jgi:hypothetical protein
MATIADLARDETARSLLHWWSNHPWADPGPLADRCEELGEHKAAEWFRDPLSGNGNEVVELALTRFAVRLLTGNVPADVCRWKELPRRRRQAGLAALRQLLMYNFGDFLA